MSEGTVGGESSFVETTQKERVHLSSKTEIVIVLRTHSAHIPIPRNSNHPFRPKLDRTEGPPKFHGVLENPRHNDPEYEWMLKTSFQWLPDRSPLPFGKRRNSEPKQNFVEFLLAILRR